MQRVRECTSLPLPPASPTLHFQSDSSSDRRLARTLYLLPPHQALPTPAQHPIATQVYSTSPLGRSPHPLSSAMGPGKGLKTRGLRKLSASPSWPWDGRGHARRGAPRFCCP